MAKTKKETPSVQLVKKKTVASKSTINLSCHKSSFQPKRVIPVVLIIIVAGALFAKFGFLDLIDKKGDAYSDLAQKQETYSAVNARLIGYDELADQYGRYSYGWLTETEASLVDRMDLLEILEDTISPAAIIHDFAINNNVVSVNLSDITLDETSALVMKLESDPRIESVTVYSAKADDSDMKAQVAMTIIMQKEAAENE